MKRDRKIGLIFLKTVLFFKNVFRSETNRSQNRCQRGLLRSRIAEMMAFQGGCPERKEGWQDGRIEKRGKEPDQRGSFKNGTF